MHGKQTFKIYNRFHKIELYGNHARKMEKRFIQKGIYLLDICGSIKKINYDLLLTRLHMVSLKMH